MTSHRILAWASVPVMALALAACGGGGDSGGDQTVTVEQASAALSELGCSDVQTEQDTDDSGIAFTLVGCELGAGGGVAVNITADETTMRDVVCRDAEANEQSRELEIAYGSNWVGIVITTEGSTVSDLAAALGGQTGTVGSYCGL